MWEIQGWIQPNPFFQLFLPQLFCLKMPKKIFKAMLISQPCWSATLNETTLTFDWQCIVLLQALIYCSFCPPTHQMLQNLNSTITSNKAADSCIGFRGVYYLHKAGHVLKTSKHHKTWNCERLILNVWAGL